MLKILLMSRGKVGPMKERKKRVSVQFRRFSESVTGKISRIWIGGVKGKDR
jgi:hypothetical protein